MGGAGTAAGTAGTAGNLGAGAGFWFVCMASSRARPTTGRALMVVDPHVGHRVMSASTVDPQSPQSDHTAVSAASMPAVCSRS